MSKSVCFVIMPFGRKPDVGGRLIDFDAIFDNILEPSVLDVGLLAVRADKEVNSGLIHKAMYERLLLSEYAIADLTILNANVFYELGVRHAVRPQSTVLLTAEASRLPFDVGMLQALPYSLDAAGRPNKVKADRAALTTKLKHCTTHGVPDSPLFKLLEGFAPPTVAHEKTDIFRGKMNGEEARRQKLRVARASDATAIDDVRAEMGDLGVAEATVVTDLLLAYRAVKAWDRMIALYDVMDPVLARTPMAREQYALALNRAGRGRDAERVLTRLIAERGPSSETHGLLGRVYKDRWRAAKTSGDAMAASSALNKAIEAYRAGFEADWRDAFPGVNAATLMEIRAPGAREVATIVPVARYAAERKIARGAGDYWDYATLLELAVLERDDAAIEARLVSAWGEKENVDGWNPESTAANLRDIEAARTGLGEDTAALRRVIDTLDPPKA
jgi:hypothetical protein